MNNLYLSPIQRELLHTCRKLGKSQLETEKVIRLAEEGPDDARRIRDYYFTQAEGRGIELFSPYPFGRPDKQFMSDSGCFVGYALVGDQIAGRFSVPGQELTESHILVTGESGMGKSYEEDNLILRIKEEDPPRTIVVYDSENEHGGRLANFMGPDQLIVMDYRDYHKNLFAPMELHGPEWIDRLSSDFYFNLFIGDAGKLMLTEEALKLNDRKRVISRGGEAGYGEFVNHITSLPATGKAHQYKITLLSRLKGLANSLGPIYNHVQGFSWDDFAGRVLVINLFGLDALARTLFTSVELSELYFHSAKNPDFRATIVFDEFHRFAAAGRRDEFAVSSVADIAKTGRKRGLWLIGGEQNISLIDSEVLGNVGTVLSFRTKDPRDRKITCMLLNFDQEQSEGLSLLKRQDVVFMSGCLDEPVLLRTPDMNLRDLSREALERSRPFVEEHHRRFREAARTRRASNDDNSDLDVRISQKPPERRHEDSLIKFIRVIALNPFLKQKDYFSLLRINGGTGVKMKNEAVSLGFVEEFSVNPGGKGGSFKCLHVTGKGLAFARLEGAIEKPRGKGGREHVCLQHMVTRRLNALGIEAVVEGDINGKNVDVKVYLRGKVHACEIELQITPQTLKNILDDMEHGADMVKVLVRSKKEIDKLAAMLSEHERKTGQSLLGSVVTQEYISRYV